MTRKEILAQYKVDEHGRILSPGKFEGEMLYAPYFWDAYLEGLCDDDCGHYVWFEIDQADRDIFPELDHEITHVRLHTDDNGFVFCVEDYREDHSCRGRR